MSKLSSGEGGFLAWCLAAVDTIQRRQTRDKVFPRPVRAVGNRTMMGWNRLTESHICSQICGVANLFTTT